MLSTQFLGAQGFRRSRLEWLGDYAPRENGPRRELEGLGRIVRRNFPIRGRTTAAFEDHSWLPSSGGWLLGSSDAQGLQVAADCGLGYVQLLGDQTLRFVGLDPDRCQPATFPN